MQNKKHIAMYIGSLNKGGAERVMCNLAEYFFKEGYEVTLVTTYLSDDEYEVPDGNWKALATPESEEKLFPGEEIMEVITPEDDKRRVIVNRNKKGISRVFTALLPGERSGRISNFFLRFGKLRNTWRKIKPDLILSFLGKNNIMAISTSLGLNIAVVVSVRSNPSREYGAKSLDFSMNLLFPRAAGVVVQTTGAGEYFKKSIRDKSIVLPNSVHPDFINREVIPFEKRTKTIVSVGRLDYNKNQILLIRAFGEIMDRFAQYRLVIYGDGPQRKEFERVAADILKDREASLGDAPRIEFKGNVSGVAERISDAEVFVLTSRQEGMPNALIEAMALGLTCISTDCPCGGPADIIKNEENGLLIPMGDDKDMLEALSTALERVMTDREFSCKLSEKASEVRNIYSPDKINRQWKEYLTRFM